jgi:hypothetical protein
MFLQVYESRRIPFDDGAVIVSRTPCPQEPYEAQLDGDEEGPKGYGDTVLSAIADLNRVLANDDT